MIEFMKFCFASALLAGVSVCVCAGIVGFNSFSPLFSTTGLEGLGHTAGVFLVGFIIAIVSTFTWLALDLYSRRFPATQLPLPVK